MEKLTFAKAVVCAPVVGSFITTTVAHLVSSIGDGYWFVGAGEWLLLYLGVSLAANLFFFLPIYIPAFVMLGRYSTLNCKSIFGASFAISIVIAVGVLIFGTHESTKQFPALVVGVICSVVPLVSTFVFALLHLPPDHQIQS